MELPSLPHRPRAIALTVSDILDDARRGRLRIVFLQRMAGFVHSSVLPYRFPLIILARLFQRHPQLHPRNRTLLTRWVWRGALGGEHSDSSHATVQAHLDDIGDDEHGSIQRLLRRAPWRRGLPAAEDPGNGRAATSRLFATAMLTREADAHLKTGGSSIPIAAVRR